MKTRAVIIAEHTKLFDAISRKFEDSGVEVSFIKRSELDSREKAKKLAAEEVGKGAKYVIYSSFLGKDSYPEHLFDMDKETFNRWKKDVFNRSYYASSFAKELSIRDGGKFIYVGPVSGEVPMGKEQVEGPAAAANFMDMMNIASELGSEKFTVNAFAIGRIDGEDAEDKHMLDHIPEHRYGNADEIAAYIVGSMMSEDYFMNGNITTIDGGFSRSYMREW